MSIRDLVHEKLADKIVNFSERLAGRFYIGIKPIDIKEAAKVLFKELGLRFSTATGCDTAQGIELIYHFSCDKTGEIFNIRVLLEDKNNPQIDSITPIIRGAEWIEREIWELLGVDFPGHPDLKHLLLIDEWPKDKYPLRKG